MKWLFVALVFLLSAIFVLLKTNSIFFALPNLILSIFTFYNLKKLSESISLVLVIIYIQLIVKLILIPILMPNEIVFKNKLDVGLLIAYELIVIIFIIKFFLNRRKTMFYTETSIAFTQFNSIIIILFLLLALYSYFNLEILIQNISFLGSKSTYLLLQNYEDDNQGYAGIIFTIFRYLFTIISISYIYTCRLSENKKLYLILILILFFSLFIIKSSRFSIIYYLLSSTYLLYMIFPKKQKLIAYNTFISIFLIILLSTIFKLYYIQSRNSIDIEFNIVSYEMLNSYFSGPSNVDNGLTALKNANIDKLKLISSDIIKNVPGLSHLSYENMNTTRIFNNVLYKLYYSSEDQIPPLIIFGYAHSSKILSPIYIALFLFLAFYFEELAHRSISIVHKYLFILISIRFSFVTMSNFSSVIGGVILTILCILPILIATVKTKK